MQYRKKPIIIEAIRWNGKNFDEIMNFMKEDHGNKGAYEDACDHAHKTKQIIISTPDGNMPALLNDYIIEGITGEFWPCNEDIFIATHEHIDWQFETSL